MGLLDKNILMLPGARRIVAALAVSGVLDALCIIVQGVSLGIALSLVWEGAGAAVVGIMASASVAEAGGIDWAGVAQGALVFFAGYAGRQAISYTRARMMNHFARERSEEMQAQLVSATYDGGPAFVAAFGTGNITTTTIEGIDRVENYLEIILPKVTDLIAIPTILCVGLFALDWVSGIIALIMLPCIVLYMRMLGRNAREAAARQHGAYVRLGNHFIDTVRGIRTLAFFGRSKMTADEVYAVSERARTISMKAIQVATLSSLLLDLFRTFALAAIAIMLGFRLMDGSIALTPALAVLIIVPEYFAAIRRFSTDFHASLDGKNQLAAVLDMIAWQQKNTPSTSNQPNQQASVSGMQPTDIHGKQSASMRECPDAGAPMSAKQPADSAAANEPGASLLRPPLPVLSLSSISYSYHPAGASNKTSLSGKATGNLTHCALDNLSFNTEGSLHIGIVGVSGSGKSTLARIIAGFASPTQGSIAVNDIPTDLRSQAWRSTVTYIPQNPHIFHGSVLDNIAFYQPDATRSAVIQAAHAAGLDEVIATLPQGFDTLIGEGGRALSGGQAQRIALARAFLDDNRRVLVFDEPTAHLDLETEFRLKSTMLPLMNERLVFFATHRLHWMRNMDMLLVLDEGRLAEQGSYDDLLVHNGAFAHLVARLSGATPSAGNTDSAGSTDSAGNTSSAIGAAQAKTTAEGGSR